MRTVMERLRDGLAGFPATERRVAHRILADYPVAGLQSASDLARDVGVSAPSVLRMVSRMGFASYPDFQRVMREELTAQLSSPLSKSPAAARRQIGTTVAPRLQKFVTVLEGNLHETFTHLPTVEFDQVVRLLADRRLRLHLIGGRFTDALARYLSAQLRIVRPGVNHLEDQEDNWYDQVLDMGKRDVLVVFDIRRYQPSLLRLAEAAAKRQVRLVLITDQWLSPISRLAAHVLPARVAVPSVWDSSVALMAIVEALLAEATQLDWDYGQKRMRELEAVRDAAPSPGKAASAAKKTPVRRAAAGKR
jgi:DNA-binding MurR/RpiR family transcriptional regulator